MAKTKNSQLGSVKSDISEVSAKSSETQIVETFTTRIPVQVVPKKSRTMSDKAGLVFNVIHFKKQLMRGNYAKTIRPGKYIGINFM